MGMPLEILVTTVDISEPVGYQIVENYVERNLCSIKCEQSGQWIHAFSIIKTKFEM